MRLIYHLFGVGGGRLSLLPPLITFRLLSSMSIAPYRAGVNKRKNSRVILLTKESFPRPEIDYLYVTVITEGLRPRIEMGMFYELLAADNQSI